MRQVFFEAFAEGIQPVKDSIDMLGRDMTETKIQLVRMKERLGKIESAGNAPSKGT